MALPFFKRTPQQEEMSFIDHLEELRWHVVRSLIAIIVFAVVIFVFRDWVFDVIISGPLRDDFISYEMLCSFSYWIGAGDTLCLPPAKVELQSLTFGSQFMKSISISFIGGLMVAFPYIFWEIWRFIKPALNDKEVKYSRGAIVFVSFFFFAGAAFGYFLMAPFTFSFLSNFTLGTENAVAVRPSLDDYVSNLTDITLGAAFAFQLPVVAYVLSKIGLVTPMFLKSYRKYAYVALLVIAAIITPSPDWMSQMIVCLPLVALYEFSIIISSRIYKAQQEKLNS